MIENITKADVYKRLKILENNFISLSNFNLASKGANSLAQLIVKLINKLLTRYYKFTYTTIKLLSGLCINLQKLFGYLNQSKVKNIPWSIIPSLEILFSRLRPGSEFIISPIWEENYQIQIYNLITTIKEHILSQPGLIFDSKDPKTFYKEIESFLKDFPAVYI